jgi:hypothetical protein
MYNIAVCRANMEGMPGYGQSYGLTAPQWAVGSIAIRAYDILLD